MAKKESEEVEKVAIAHLSVTSFGRADLDALAAKVNEIISSLN